MAIRNILLAYSGEAAYGSSLRHAINLTKYHDGWLTGVLRHGRSIFDRRAPGLSDELRARLREAEAEDVARTVALFNEAVSDAGLSERAEFIDLDDTRDDPLSAFARTYDLLVTGFHSSLPSDEHLSASADTLALQSGRPVLVVPEGYVSPGIADHALLAWDGKRSAARALGDAMEVLEGKRKVTVLTVGPEPCVAHQGGGILRHLQRHGIEATFVCRDRSGRSIADVIEDTADEVCARLIVMGAYEHSKFSQDLFGGVTSAVLKTARVPVFMSH